MKYARALLDRDDLASRLYRRIKDAAAADAPADLTLSAMTRSRGGELFSLGEDSEATSIPGLFTRAGYHSLFKKKMDLGLMGLEREDGWVMGKEKDNPLPKVGVARNGALINPVQKQILAL